MARASKPPAKAPEAAAPRPDSTVSTAAAPAELADPLPAPQPEAPAAEPAMAGYAAPTPPGVPPLYGVTLRFWQAQLEHAMATGQAILRCRSPQEAVRLQIDFVQASLASGLAHAGQIARLSRDLAQDTLSLPRR